ncbi:MAG: OmpA family protein [Cytophagales bacterium]|nr:OmpA family protein [Cytophagales bacterium]MDW8385341.1 OmpA family protein [Flammeovirgaceae bacterium]
MRKQLLEVSLYSAIGLFFVSCVSQKQYAELQKKYEESQKRNNELSAQLLTAEKEAEKLRGDIKVTTSTEQVRQEQIADLRKQLADCQAQRDKQVAQVDNLTVLSKSANENIRETLAQLEKKDNYIKYLQAAKSKADSINLALAINLTSVLKDGIEDKDVDVKVDKTVVYINLSDKMLYQTGSATLTPRAKEVLGKIAKIIESRPDIEVMVEGHTDNTPIRSTTEDNWDLSVKRSVAVVKVLQNDYKVTPSRLIAAGRGEYLPIAPNTTEEGKALNRRTRIILLPQLNQFYELLNPNNVPQD